MIELSVNNESVQVPAGMLLSEALLAWQYADQKVAIAINGEFVPRSTYAECALQAGDEIDIVKPIGGG